MQAVDSTLMVLAPLNRGATPQVLSAAAACHAEQPLAPLPPFS